MSLRRSSASALLCTTPTPYSAGATPLPPSTRASPAIARGTRAPCAVAALPCAAPNPSSGAWSAGA
eukprot:3977753-Prymnesium_polylepis.1